MRPRINLVLYHGVLAPHARWRARVVAYGVVPAAAPLPPGPSAAAGDETASATPPPQHWACANPMRRAFDIDVLACPRCGGRLRLLGVVEDPIAICQILTALALTADQANRAPPAVASPSILQSD